MLSSGVLFTVNTMAGEQPNEGLSGSCPEFNSLGRAAALTKTSSGFHPSQSEHSGEC